MSLTPAEHNCWQKTWRAIQATPPPALLNQLAQRYGEPHRAYHTLDHVRTCLAHLDNVRALLRYPAQVELAIWFHDAIYDPRAADNEAQSARWAQDALLDADVESADAQRIARLIRLTRHDLAPPENDGDARLLLDIDLAILGAEPMTFDRYEAQIRQEYAWVPWPEFCRKRAAILRKFLQRSAIYRTDYFTQRLEQPARLNLQRSVETFSRRTHP